MSTDAANPGVHPVIWQQRSVYPIRYHSTGLKLPAEPAKESVMINAGVLCAHKLVGIIESTDVLDDRPSTAHIEQEHDTSYKHGGRKGRGCRCRDI